MATRKSSNTGLFLVVALVALAAVIYFVFFASAAGDGGNGGGGIISTLPVPTDAPVATTAPY